LHLGHRRPVSVESLVASTGVPYRECTMKGLSVVVAAVTAATVGLSAPAGAEQVFGGWFGNWQPPATVKARVAGGSGVLTDVAVFAWSFDGRGNPVCALTFHSGCVPRSAATPYQSPQLGKSLRSVSGPRRWASYIDLDSSRAGQLAALMKDESQRDAMTTKVTDFAVSSGVDGVDLDWENFAFNDGSGTWASTRPAFVATVKQLAAKLHVQDKLLSVTVPAGAHPFTPSGTPKPGSGYTVYAWSQIADDIDRLNLMTYDYSYNTPGPIGPNPWAEQVVRSAVAQVGADNAGKVVVGAPLYGKVWPSRSATGGLVTTGACPANWRSKGTPDTFSVTPPQARALAAEHGTSPGFDKSSSEYTFRYSEAQAGRYTATVGRKKHRHRVTRTRTCQVQRTVWFSDGRSLIDRGRMAATLDIGGVFIWNLGSITSAMVRSYAAASSSFPSVHLAALPTGLVPYRRMAVTARVKNIARGTQVRLQAGDGSSWTTVATARVNKHRRVTWRVRTPASADADLRAAVTTSEGEVRSNPRTYLVSRYFSKIGALLVDGVQR
jgi:spore germination protein YaaH